jgi:tRNA A37 N6-isopentenylltransferase MiaA
MKNRLNTAIHQFAKRQETWFRRMEKKGVVINWLQSNDYSLLKESVMKFSAMKKNSLIDIYLQHYSTAKSGI